MSERCKHHPLSSLIARLGPLGDINLPPSPFPVSAPEPTVAFGRVQNVPFMLNIPPPQTPRVHPWVPPSSPFIAKTFPQPDIRDVDMAEPSPPRPPPVEQSSRRSEDGPSEENKERAIAVGGLKRVFRSRQRAKGKSKQAAGRTRVETEDEEDSEAESEGESRAALVHRKQTSNHYTLNLPPPTAPRSDAPYVLLGYVFLHNSIHTLS